MDGEGGRKIGSFLDFHSCLHETPCNTFPRSPRRNNFMQNKLSSFPRFSFPFSRIDSGKTESFAEMDIRPFRIRGSSISMYSEPTSDKDDERSLPRGTDRIINFSESKVHRISPSPLSIDPPPPSPSRGSFYTISTRVRKRYIQKGRGLYCSVRPSSIVKRGTREK